MKKFKTGIIGLGRVAFLLENDPLRSSPCTHAGAYNLNNQIIISAGSDLIKENRIEFNSRYGANIYKNHIEMLKKENLDIVSICAYAPERKQMIKDCIEYGVKALWCEKAIATCLSDADEIAKLCKKHNTVFLLNHIRRWYSSYRTAKDLIDDNSIGTLRSLSCIFSGNLLHTGTHAFDILQMFAGDPLWVTGNLDNWSINKYKTVSGYKHHSVKEKINDFGGSGYIQFKNEVYATVHGEGKDYFIFEIDVIGSKGRIKLRNDGPPQLYKTAKSKFHSGMTELNEITWKENYSPVNPWQLVVEDLIDSITNQKETKNNADTGKTALEIAIGIFTSGLNNSEKVYFPLKTRDFEINSR